MATFAELLKLFREQAGASQRALSRASGVNPAIISRMESGDRGPSGPEQVLAIAEALQLSPERTDALLAASGHWPRTILAVGPRDETLLAVARVLASDDLGDAARERFRRTVELLVEQWMETGR